MAAIYEKTDKKYIYLDRKSVKKLRNYNKYCIPKAF
jgi:hypothetical protein